MEVLSSFAPTGDFFALATPDGRLRVFDTGAGRLVASLSEASASGATANGGHLTEALTCMCWVVPKERKKQAAVPFPGLAVGSATGAVKLYDVKLGELKWKALDCIEGGVLSLTFAASSGTLLAAGQNGSICSLDMLKGKVLSKFEASKYPLRCISLSHDASLIFGGGSSMQLWDASSEERVAKYTGHATELRTVAYIPGTSYAVSAASGERQVSVWEVPPAKKSKKQHPAVGSLVLDEPAVQLDASTSPQQGSFHVAAVSEAGEAYVWRCQGSEDSRVSSELLLRVRVGAGATKGASAGKDESIFAARLQSTATGQSLMVARGSTAKPVFEAVSLSAGDSSAAGLVSLPPVGGVLLGDGPASSTAPLDKSISAQKKNARSPADVNVLGPENLGQPVVLRPPTDVGTAPATGRKRAAQDDEGAAVLPDQAAAAAAAAARAQEEEEVPDLPEGEAPLGERVAALEARILGSMGPPQEEAGPSDAMPAGSAKADSLSVLLTQAIRSNDRALLERCLATGSSTIVNNTVARIVPTDAALFLKAAVDRLLSRPNRAVQLVPWIKAVLHHHTGYLMTAPTVQPTLTALFQAIDNRIKLHEPLLKVYGRLGLVLHHTRADAATGAEPGRPGPEVVFEDDLDEDDEPTAEDAFAPGAPSDDDDDDDEGEDDEDEDDEDNEFDAMLAGGGGGGSDDDDDMDDLEDLADLDDL